MTVDNFLQHKDINISRIQIENIFAAIVSFEEAEIRVSKLLQLDNVSIEVLRISVTISCMYFYQNRQHRQ